MFSRKRSSGRNLGLSALVVLATLTVAQHASAALVQFTTTGIFDNGLSYAQVGGSKVSFFGNDGDLDVGAGEFSNTELGVFKTTSTSTTNQTFDIGFTLFIEQFSPTLGQSSIEAELNGTLRQRNSQLELVFDTTSAQIAPVLYVLSNLGFDGKTLTLNYGNTSLDAQVSVQPSVNTVPLPAAALGGMGLMGAIGAVKFGRRRIAV
jgi:hypothetical protein